MIEEKIQQDVNNLSLIDDKIRMDALKTVLDQTGQPVDWAPCP